MSKLPKLPSGNIKLGADHFRKVRDRIEEIVPLAGQNIKAEQTAEGIIISVTTAGLNAGLTICDLPRLSLNVCKNGIPGYITVFGSENGEDSFGCP